MLLSEVGAFDDAMGKFRIQISGCAKEENNCMGMIDNDWLTELGAEFRKPYYKTLYEFVKTEYNTTQVFPPADDIFNAFHLTPLSQVKVVILGQDPYHNVGQAHGL